MDPTDASEEEDMKERTVSEIIECSRELARELLANCGGDVNKVIDTFLGSKVSEAEDQKTKMKPEGAGIAGGISSVLKRKRSVGSIEKAASDSDEENIDKDSPDETKFKKLREDLSNYLVEVRKSLSKGKEESMMKLEDCPRCSAPQILQDKTVLQYNCAECGAVICRRCKQQAHGDRQCGDKDMVDVKGGEKNEEYKKINVLPSRNFDMDSELERDFRIAEGHFLRMVRRRKSYEIKSIDIVQNEKLKKRFDQKKQELKMRGLDDKPLLIFHGTPQENIEHILRENFDLSKVVNGRRYGNGVYFSEVPEVSMKYTKDQSSLILCLVLQGDNSKEIKIPQTGQQAIDTQNSLIGALAIVVPDVDQILPKYVINFTDKPRDTEKQQQVISPGSLNLPTSSSGSANISNLASQLAAGFLARQIRVPGFPAPPVPAPGLSAPPVHVPGFPAPPVHAPGFSAPPVHAPGFSAPTVHAPGFSAPPVHAPGFSAPPVPVPSFSTPSFPTPGFSASAVSAPGFIVPASSPFLSQAASQTSQSTPACHYAGQAGLPTYPMSSYLMPQMSQILSQVSQMMAQTMSQISQISQTMPQMQTVLSTPQAMIPGMPQMPQTTPWMSQTQQAMPGILQAASGIQQAVSGMRQAIPGIPQAMPVMQQAMPGMQLTIPQVVSPLTQMHPTTTQPPTTTAVIYQQQSAARQAQWRAMVTAVAGTITAQARAQATSSAASKAVAPLLTKSTKGKVGRPPKVKKEKKNVTSKGDGNDACGTASGSVNHDSSQVFLCDVCDVRMPTKELMDEHKKGREHRMKERSAK